MRSLIGLCAMLAMAAVACNTGSGTAGDSSAPPETQSVSDLDAADAAALRSLTEAYWDAFNGYEPDTVLSLLEPGYRAERDETIRSEIGRLSAFGVTLGVSVETPPALIGPDEAETLVSLRTPLGSRQVRMVFTRIEGEWWITFAQTPD